MGQAIESLRHVYENGVNIGRSTQRTVKVSYEFKCHISRNIGRGLLPKNLLKSPLDLYTSHWHNAACHLATMQNERHHQHKSDVPPFFFFSCCYYSELE